jgi:hypothetical protein
MVGRRRARSDEYAERVNGTVALLGECSPADAVRALQGEHGVSERQARRYVRAAQLAPDGVAVPERTAVFTVKLPVSLIARLRAAARGSGRSVSATAAEALRVGLERVAPGQGRGGREGGKAR